jgi:hypothetical protein
MASTSTRLNPMQGFCAETGGALALFMATNLGIPVSTTHTITGAIVGVGAARRVSAVRWNVAREIVVAWVITMPAAAVLVAAITRPLVLSCDERIDRPSSWVVSPLGRSDARPRLEGRRRHLPHRERGDLRWVRRIRCRRRTRS